MSGHGDSYKRLRRSTRRPIQTSHYKDSDYKKNELRKAARIALKKKKRLKYDGENDKINKNYLSSKSSISIAQHTISKKDRHLLSKRSMDSSNSTRVELRGSTQDVHLNPKSYLNVIANNRDSHNYHITKKKVKVHEVIDLIDDENAHSKIKLKALNKGSPVEKIPKTTTFSESRNKCNVAKLDDKTQDIIEIPTSDDPSNEDDKIHKCHSCDVLLKPPYTIHAHPSLAISVCARCAQLSYSIERDVQDIRDVLKEKKKINEPACVEENVDSCCFCSGESFLDSAENEFESLSKLFLCDSCPRAFCGRCIRIGTDGKIDTLQKLDLSEKKWECLVCSINLENNINIIPGLTKLQNEFQRISSDTATKAEVETEDERAQKLITELDELESDIEQATEKLEQKNLIRQREKIKKEILEENIQEEFDDLMVEEEIDEEMELYVKEWKAHHTRLVEALPPLQEALEEAGISILAFYATRNKNIEKRTETGYKKAADKEVDARAAKMGFSRLAFRGASGYKSSNPKVYSLDMEDVPPDLLKVEDINTTENALEMIEKLRRAPGASNRAAFGGMQLERFTQVQDDDYVAEREKDFRKQFLKAVKIDDLELSEMKVTKKCDRTVSEENDKNSEKIELKSVNTARRRVVQEELWLNTGSRKFHKKHKIMVKKTNQLSTKIDNNTHATKPKKKVTPTLVSNENITNQQDRVSPQDSPVQQKIYPFYSSSFILNQPEAKSICVSKDLTEKLKSHQKDGIQFMWNNVCKSLTELNKFPPVNQNSSHKVCGCIIAHSMGLGKTLQVIAFLHTLFKHPALDIELPNPVNSLIPHLREQRNKRLFHRALICVPVNTIANWSNEFRLWLGNQCSLKLHIIESSGAQAKFYRPKVVEDWYKHGGILLTSFDLYVSLVGERSTKLKQLDYDVANADLMHKALQNPGPDIIIIDEAHQVLKKNSNKNFKALSSILTTRRVALTGTPIQNNLIEYYHLINWIQPGILGTIQEFERKYVLPIKYGMASDSSHENKTQLLKQSQELYNKLSPYVQRLDSSILRKDLPYMQQAVIHVRMSKCQARLYRAFKKFEKHEKVGMIEQCLRLRPVYNHPGCLLMKSRSTKATNANANGSIEREWWHRIYEKHPNLTDIRNGGKIFLLLQIVAHADLIGDKVVVFSQSITTLDFIETVLNSSRWEDHVRALNTLRSNYTWGPWKKNKQYLRMDGSNTASERGELIASFNEKGKDENEFTNQIKLFLISTAAGGIGTNLAAANRVVLFDTHFNPAVDMQALYRCYRYGQTKPVYAYRLLAEGTMVSCTTFFFKMILFD